MTNAREMTTHLADLLSREHAAMAEFLVTLAGFDRKRQWMEIGYASLFDFLHRELGLSAGAAYLRKTAAALVQRFPEIIEALREGKLCLSTVGELAKVITPENRSEVLPRFFHRSKKEAALVAAELRPKPAPQRDAITPLPAPPVATPRREAGTAAPVDAGQISFHPDETAAERVRAGETSAAETDAAPHPAPRDEVEPYDATHARLHVTVSRGLLEKIDKARAALSHSRPNATRGEILEAALDALLAADARKKGLATRPQKNPRPTNDPRHVPAAVRRAVLERSGGRCEFPLEGGGVCGSTWRVELDHIRPRAQGGDSSVENVRVTCEFHNVRAARLALGDACMDRYTSIAAPGEAGP
jgi:hypothetical protein